jgi:hypothetical protein
MKLKNYLEEKASLWDVDVDYVIKDGKSLNSYVVTSWTTGKGPKNIYNVIDTHGKWSCNCPAKGICKHIQMVKEYLRNGKPDPFKDPELENKLKKMLSKKGVMIR